MRPPVGAKIQVTYDYGAGREGNVGPNAVNQAPALPAGLKVLNAVRTWGGAEAETTAEGEKQITRYLQHRDRLVTAEDFATIAKRTPGVDIGRVEVLAAYNPTLTRQEPGSAPGAVTLMLIPKYSSIRPDAPSPDQPFLASVCAFLDPRRSSKRNCFARAEYVNSGFAAIESFPPALIRSRRAAVVRERSKRGCGISRAFHTALQAAVRRTVSQLELMAVVSRFEGVALVNKLILAAGDGGEVPTVPLTGLQLPRLDGMEVVVGGDPLPLAQLRGAANAGPTTPGKKIVPVPVIPPEC